uniref:VP2 protein n=1 Tax=Equine encephalosis virus TaxID=201490 RepID=A0A891ZTP0_9REOV|nr:VP2 protein [Equine encephalosis virus]
MDFRVLICYNVNGASSLSDDDLETYEDESTIILRVNNKYLVDINSQLDQQEDIFLLGGDVPNDNTFAGNNAWPKNLTSFDLFDPTDSITEVLKKTKLGVETTTSQLVSIRYGKIAKDAKRLKGVKNQGALIKGTYVEMARAEEQLAKMCEIDQHRDVMTRDIMRGTGNRIKIRTLIGEINLPGWLEGTYSLSRESKHLEVCDWSRHCFTLYEMGVLFLYESFKYIDTKTIGEDILSKASPEMASTVRGLIAGKFQREKFKQLRSLSIVPKCTGGADYSVPEGTLYELLSVYMKILEVSSEGFLREERGKIVDIVHAHVPQDRRNFVSFKATGASRMLQAINNVLNVRDNILGIARTHRTLGRFYFATDTREYKEWMAEMGQRGFSAEHYADWIMRCDSTKLEEFFTLKMNFANFLRWWKVIPRDFKFSTVYERTGVRLSGKRLERHFDDVFVWFKDNVRPLIHRGEDGKLFSKIVELTIKSAYDGIPHCKPESLVSFLKALSFCVSGEKIDDQFRAVTVSASEEDGDGLFWSARQVFDVPTREGILLSAESLEGCEEYFGKIIEDPMYEAASEDEVLKGETDKVHHLFPKDKIGQDWIVVPRFIGYSYKLYRARVRGEADVRVGFAEALLSPQCQYLRHGIVVKGGCRQARKRVVDRSYTNRIRLETPNEREGNHPCLVAKLVGAANRGVGSILVFYFARHLKMDQLLVDLINVYLSATNRFHDDFVRKLRSEWPQHETTFREAIRVWKRTGVLRLQDDLRMMMLTPGNCYALDVKIEEALMKYFGVRVGLDSLVESMKTVKKVSQLFKHVSDLMSFKGTGVDYYVWNAMIVITLILCPDFLESPKTIPIFTATNKKVVAIPVLMKDYTLGNVAMNAVRYLDTVAPPQLLSRELSSSEIKMLYSLADVYLDSPDHIKSPRGLEGIYTPFQSWVGMGCLGIREKFEIMVPTSKPTQSHFVVTLSSGDVSESDAHKVRAALDEGTGMGTLDVRIGDDGVIRVTDSLPKVKRYKHLTHNEMLDGNIIRLDTASRFDTYMAAKILN